MRDGRGVRLKLVVAERDRRTQFVVSMYGERERCVARGGQRARVGSWSGHETFGNRTFGVATACRRGRGRGGESAAPLSRTLDIIRSVWWSGMVLSALCGREEEEELCGRVVAVIFGKSGRVVRPRSISRVRRESSELRRHVPRARLRCAGLQPRSAIFAHKYSHRTVDDGRAASRRRALREPH